MAVADLVQEVFEHEAVRGPLTTRGVLYTSMGPWATGTAAVFLNDSAGTDGGAAGTATFARGGTGALAARSSRRRGPQGVDVRTGAEVVAIRSNRRTGSRRRARRRHETRRARSSSRPPTPSARFGSCDPVELNPLRGLARRRTSVSRGRPPRSTSCCRGCRRSTESPTTRSGCTVASSSVRRSITSSGRWTPTSTDTLPRIRCSRPRSRRCVDPSLAPEGTARDVDPVPGGAAPAARRRLDDASATGSATSP